MRLKNKSAFTFEIKHGISQPTVWIMALLPWPNKGPEGRVRGTDRGGQ